MVVDFNFLNYNSIDDRIYFLRYVLEKELDILMFKGNKLVSNKGEKYLSDFYYDSIKLLDIYLKFNNKKSENNLGFGIYSLCTLHTTFYFKTYESYLNKYLKDSDLNMDIILKHFKNSDRVLLENSVTDNLELEEVDVVHLSNKKHID